MTDQPSRGRLIAVGSVRSCAATTTATALAQVWPVAGRVVLVEVDPAGGTVAARHGLATAPGLGTWAAAARREHSNVRLADHCQQLAGGVPVLVAPASGEQTRAALTVLGGQLTALAEGGDDVIADVGRLESGSPCWPVVEAADLVLLVCRPELADLHALAAWLDSYAGRARRLVVVLAGSGSYPRAEIADALPVEVLDGLPWDPNGLRELTPGRSGRRKGPLARAANALTGAAIYLLPDTVITVQTAPVASGAPAGSGPGRPAAESLAPPRPVSRPAEVLAGQVTR